MKRIKEFVNSNDLECEIIDYLPKNFKNKNKIKLRKDLLYKLEEYAK